MLVCYSSIRNGHKETRNWQGTRSLPGLLHVSSRLAYCLHLGGYLPFDGSHLLLLLQDLLPVLRRALLQLELLSQLLLFECLLLRLEPGPGLLLALGRIAVVH